MSSDARAELQKSKPLLGTFVTIRLTGSPIEVLDVAIESAFGELFKVHELMNFYDPESDVSKINRCEAGKTVLLHPWTWQVLKFSQELAEKTSGAFDVTGGNFRDIELVDFNRLKVNRSIRVDLSGIAKGFAVDRAVDILRAQMAIMSAEVRAGGDSRIYGVGGAPDYAESISSRDGLFVTVIAPECMTADALSKIVTPTQGWDELLAQMRATAKLIYS